MKTLVIHPNDRTTDFLKDIYKDFWFTVINNNPSHKVLINAINNHDRIIILWHWTEEWLLWFWRFVINSKHVDLLRNKDCVCVWCFANKFVSKYWLKWFNTWMIISEMPEAEYFNIHSTVDEINHSNNLFSKWIREWIISNNIFWAISEVYDWNTNVINYNRNNLFNN